MTSRSEIAPLSSKERRDYGFARVRDIAFDAVQELWRRRKNEGMRQTDIAAAIGRNPGWVSRKLKAPGNWTLRSLGEFVEALNGEIEIVIHGLEDPPSPASNYHAYADYGLSNKATSEKGAQIMGGPTATGWVPAGN